MHPIEHAEHWDNQVLYSEPCPTCGDYRPCLHTLEFDDTIVIDVPVPAWAADDTVIVEGE